MWKRILIWITGILVLALLAFLFFDFISDQSYPSSWIARYDGPAGINSYNEAHDIAIDGSGNVYVAGSSIGAGLSSDYAIVKYDKEGTEQWEVRYDGPIGSFDRLLAMTVDDAGNVYVTGYSTGKNTHSDYTTIKFDSGGNRLWVANYDGPTQRSDEASAIAVDSAGNVYVSGYSAGQGADYLTVKYDQDGNQQWVARYNGPGNSNDSANAITTDASGNVYVTGSSSGNGTLSDYATIKYDTSGNMLWLARYNGPAGYNDTANDIAVDESGNICVTGSGCITNDPANERFDFVTLKYDPAGNQLWEAQYNGPYEGKARANAVVIDNAGNIYITGDSTFRVKDYETSDAVTIKYDSQGNQLWVSHYNSPEKLVDGANDITIDESGNTYITGSSAGIGTSADYITVKYSGEGDELWFSRYNGSLNLRDIAMAIAIDSTGSIYTTGYSFTGDDSSEFVTIKYAPDSEG